MLFLIISKRKKYHLLECIISEIFSIYKSRTHNYLTYIQQKISWFCPANVDSKNIFDHQTHTRLVPEFFQNIKTVIYPSAKDVRFSLNLRNLTPYFVFLNVSSVCPSSLIFKLIFMPIRELSEFFAKYKHICFSCLTISEIFSWFGENFWLWILLLLRFLLILLAALTLQ